MTPKQVIDSLVYLSGVCDGATTRDGAGFNGRDSRFGKDLAVKPQRCALTGEQMKAAQKMLVKYTKQLRLAGIV